MNRSVSAVVAAAVFFVNQSFAADPPRYATTFHYETRFGDGKRTYDENPNVPIEVWLPADQLWKCRRDVPVPVAGYLRSGFSCTNDDWRTNMIVIVGCKQESADPVHTAGLRIFAPRGDGKPQGAPVPPAEDGGVPAPPFGKWVEFAVRCETTAVP